LQRDILEHGIDQDASHTIFHVVLLDMIFFYRINYFEYLLLVILNYVCSHPKHFSLEFSITCRYSFDRFDSYRYTLHIMQITSLYSLQHSTFLLPECYTHRSLSPFTTH